MRDILTTQLYTEAALLNHKARVFVYHGRNKGTKTISTQSLKGNA